MKQILKNIPILGFILRWLYNLVHLNNLKHTLFLQQSQLDYLVAQERTLFQHIEMQNSKIDTQQTQIDTQQTNLKGLLKSHNELQELFIQHTTNQHQPLLDDYYLNFEEVFRGSQDLIRQRSMEYLKYINPTTKTALDIGCGRGEWIHILQQNNIDAQGIDLNPAMLGAGAEQGVKNLQKIDAFDFLKTCPNDTFDLISAFHVIEHVPFEKLFVLLQEIKRVATPDAVILLETPNPANMLVATYNFYKDPTHLNPLPFEVVAFMLDYIGFTEIQTHFLHPYPEQAHIPEKSLTASKLNDYFYGNQDYLIVAKK